MKAIIGTAAVAVLVLLGSLAAIPYAIAAALQATATIDDQSRRVLFNASTFSASQVTAAFAPDAPPLDAAVIADALNTAARELGGQFPQRTG